MGGSGEAGIGKIASALGSGANNACGAGFRVWAVVCAGRATGGLLAQATRNKGERLRPVAKGAARGMGERGDSRAEGGPFSGLAAGRIAWAVWAGGAAALVVAIGASGALAYKHFTKAELPGCRAGSACDKLEQHWLGKVPFPPGLSQSLGFTKWPTSFLGVAFFAAILAAWVVGWRRVAPGLRGVIWIGAGASAVFVSVIVAKQEFCRYCLVSHAANFALLACMEIGLMMSKRANLQVAESGGNRRAGSAGKRSLTAFVLTFVAATLALGGKEYGIAQAAAAKMRQSQDEMVKKAQEDAKKAAAAAAQPKSEEYEFGPNGFTGRWRMGPEKAEVRIVLFGAYTCQYCMAMEKQAMELVQVNPGKVSFSFKHFPMCFECNPHMKKEDSPEEHKNACWASRCAEACAKWAQAQAAMKGQDEWAAGNEAFWKAHNWLYDRLGAFDDKSLMEGIASMGFDAKAVTDLMTAPTINSMIVKDVEEGHALGLFQTPMIFVNEVELKGWQSPGALQSTVAKLVGAGIPALSAKQGGRPPMAAEKAVKDWEEETAKTFAADKVARTLGAADAPVKVVIFGDFQEPNTAKADAIVRSWVFGSGGTAKDAASAKPIQYTFRHFPGNKACNPAVPRVIFEQGCLASKAAEAAAQVGGPEAYWKMHTWLMTNQKGFGLDAVKRGANAIGLDGDVVFSTLNTPAVEAAIAEDAGAGQAVGVTQIPMIYINGKFVKTWSREGDNVLERIVDGPAQGK